MLLLLVLFMLTTTTKGSEMEKLHSINIDRKLVSVEKRQEPNLRKEFLWGKVSNGKFLMTNQVYGISVFDQNGRLLDEQKIAKAVRPEVQECYGDSSYLLYSWTGQLLGLWDRGEAKPQKYLRFDSGIWASSIQCLPSSRNVIVFPVSQYSYGDDFAKRQKMPVFYIYELSDSLTSNGTLIREINVPKELSGENVLGRVMRDGRIFALVSRTSRLLEFNSKEELSYAFDAIEGYNGSDDTGNRDENIDYFEFIKPLPIYRGKFLVAMRNFFQKQGSLDIWNIESRQYVGSFVIGESLLLDADDQYIYLVDSIGEEEIELGKYILDIEESEGVFLSTFSLKDPITDTNYTLGSVLPAYDDKLMIIFTTPGDCVARNYIFDRQGVFFGKDDSLPEALVCYTEQDPVILSSFMNSTRDKYWMCGNVNPDLIRDMPYAVIIDRHTKIIQRLTQDEVGEMLKDL